MSHRIVYLDAQDYSRISDALEGRGDQELLPVYEQLKKFARQGDFKFCFSQTVIGEVLQLNPNDLEISRRKAAVMEELCGAQGFPSVFRMICADVVDAGRRRGFEPAPGFLSMDDVVFGGRWIRTELTELSRQLENIEAGFAEKFRERAIQRLGRPLNRKERRIGASSRTYSDARQIVESERIFQVIKDTPLFPRIVEALRHRRFQKMGDEYFRFIAKPTRLVLSHSHFESMGFFNDHVSTLKAAFLAAVTKLRADYDSLVEKYGPIDRAKRMQQMAPFLDELIVSMAKDKGGLYVKYGAPAAYFDSPHFEADVRQLPSLALWRDLMEKYLLDVTEAAPKRRTELLDSDIVDALHALYLSRCAVWRTDKYFFSLAAPIAKKRGHRVVRLLTELPAVLHQVLDASDQHGPNNRRAAAGASGETMHRSKSMNR